MGVMEGVRRSCSRETHYRRRKSGYSGMTDQLSREKCGSRVQILTKARQKTGIFTAILEYRRRVRDATGALFVGGPGTAKEAEVGELAQGVLLSAPPHGNQSKALERG